jgi:hypothetical protein
MQFSAWLKVETVEEGGGGRSWFSREIRTWAVSFERPEKPAAAGMGG